MRIDLAGFGREATAGDHRDFAAIFERADVLGYDAVWFNEFHFNREGLRYPSTLLLGAEILARTERLRCGTSVLVLPLQHPLLLAEQVAQLDYQSGGRLDVGIGRGNVPQTFAALGISPDDTRQHFEAALMIMRRAWTERSVSWTGPMWTFTDVEVGPPPVQLPHPPIYVAGYTEDTIAFAVAHDLPLLFSLEPPETRQIAVFRERLMSKRSSALRRSSLSRYIVIAPTRARADELTDILLVNLNERRAAFAAKRGGVPAAPISRERLLREQAIAGDPDTCIEQLQRTVRETGVEGLRCNFNGNGALPNEIALAGMELFAREVMPAARLITARSQHSRSPVDCAGDRS
jgi:alkanesulfonate monooxygenase SsuD/methylene tetrahydromethanopterin reductase-like flavin-dependent oxidoreductase (luciferase family)